MARNGRRECCLLYTSFRGNGVATVIPKENSIVWGLLWSITPLCENNLDKYEGYPHYYHKANVTVIDPKTGEKYDTIMMYEMDQKYIKPAIPTIGYYNSIVQGYIQNGIDDRPLYESLKKVKREVTALQKQIIWENFMKDKKPTNRSQSQHKPNNRER